MHIGLIIYGSLDTLSGGYLYDRQLVDYLRENGDRVEIISLPWSNYSRHLLYNSSNKLQRMLENTTFDILLQDELNHPSLFRLNPKLYGHIKYPIISIVHHLRCNEVWPKWQQKLYAHIEGCYLRSVDGFICNSQTTWDSVCDFLERKRPYTIAPPAGNRFGTILDETAIITRANEPGPLRIIFVGSLIPRKGLDLLLTALAKMPVDSWQLAVVGDTAAAPHYTTRCQNLTRQLEITAHVRWHGRLSKAELAQQMHNSHILAVPSSYEGFGIVYLEGMAFGLPAIATTAGAAHEIITNGENGFLVENEEIEIAAHLTQLHNNRQLLIQMSLAARQHFLQHPTWQTSMAQIREFLCALSTV
ncbi:MAG: glycosyltransferase family 4 protein [Anaerolineales bacterium]|nr:glycosyltransferase family 4 protein [Anaerolineales bacterium]